jgi:hypothetical protein
LFTQTSVQNEWGADEDIASSTNLDDFTPSYGLGGGLQIRVYNDSYNTKKLRSVFVDIGARYLKGGEGRYLKKGSIEIVDQNVVLDVIKSKTDLLTFQIGVLLAF